MFMPNQVWMLLQTNDCSNKRLPHASLYKANFYPQKFLIETMHMLFILLRPFLFILLFCSFQEFYQVSCFCTVNCTLSALCTIMALQFNILNYLEIVLGTGQEPTNSQPPVAPPPPVRTNTNLEYIWTMWHACHNTLQHCIAYNKVRFINVNFTFTIITATTKNTRPAVSASVPLFQLEPIFMITTTSAERKYVVNPMQFSYIYSFIVVTM